MNPFKIPAPDNWPQSQIERFKKLEEHPDAVLAFWNSNEKGKPCNGGNVRCAPARPGLIQRAQKPFAMCGRNALHATLFPDVWDGDRVWLVALFGDKNVNNPEKIGAIKREIVGEITLENVNNINLIPKFNNNFVDTTFFNLNTGTKAPNIYDKHFKTCRFLINSEYLYQSNIINCYFYNSEFNLTKININNSYFVYCKFNNLSKTLGVKFNNCYFLNCDISCSQSVITNSGKNNKIVD